MQLEPDRVVAVDPRAADVVVLAGQDLVVGLVEAGAVAVARDAQELAELVLGERVAS